MENTIAPEDTPLLIEDSSLPFPTSNRILPAQICPLLLAETKTLSSQAIPVAIALVLLNSIGMASVFSLGHFGTKYLAASALTTMYCNITGFVVALGLSSSLDTLCSQAYTSSNKHTVGHHLQRVLLVQFIFAIPITCLWLKTESILIFFGQDPEISYLSGVFAKCLIPGLIPFMISTCVTKYLQAQGIMKAAFFILLIAAPVNIFLQWFLVFSCYGIGEIGAPIASSITYNLVCCLLIPYAAFIEGYECWGGIDFNQMFNVRKLKDILYLGIPGILMLCSESWAFEVMALIAGYFGQEKLAAQTTMLSACSLLYLLPLGFGIAATNRIGNLLGERNYETAFLVAKATVMFGVFLGLFNSMFLLSVKNIWGFIFTDDPLVLETVGKLMPLVVFYQFSDAIKAVGSGVLQGCGLQRVGAIVNIIGYL